jgi:hypothetical protein
MWGKLAIKISVNPNRRFIPTCCDRFNSGLGHPFGKLTVSCSAFRVWRASFIRSMEKLDDGSLHSGLPTANEPATTLLGSFGAEGKRPVLFRWRLCCSCGPQRWLWRRGVQALQRPKSLSRLWCRIHLALSTPSTAHALPPNYRTHDSCPRYVCGDMRSFAACPDDRTLEPFLSPRGLCNIRKVVCRRKDRYRTRSER